VSEWEVVTGDCHDVLRDMEAESVDLFCTSPPYAQGKEYELGLDWHGLRDLMADVAHASYAVAKPSGFFFANFGETTKYDPLTMTALYSDVFTAAGWLSHSRRIWAKSFAQCRLTGAMQTHTIGAAEWEHLWTFRKPPNSNEAMRDKTLSLRGIWTTREPNGVSRDAHPAVFPAELPEKAIRIWTDIGDLVCDPFCGSGSTGVAARRMGRRFLGIELNEGYADMARTRIGQAQPPLFADEPAPDESHPPLTLAL